MQDMDIFKKVFLLAIAKREEGESMDETMKSLVNTGMFDMSEAQKVLDELRAENYIVGDNLSMTGVVVANQAEQEFKQ
jgi:hypothetical protein